VVIAGGTDCVDDEASLPPQPLSVNPSNSNVSNVAGAPAWPDLIDVFSGFKALLPLDKS